MQSPENAPKISVEDVVKFLAPIIDITTCDQISLNKLSNEHKRIVAKLSQSNNPILLRVDGEILLLCDARLYLELETRRQCVLSRFKSIEDMIQIGEIDVEDPRLVEMRALQDQSFSLQNEVVDSTINLEETEKRLTQARKEFADVRARVAELTVELEKPKCSSANNSRSL